MRNTHKLGVYNSYPQPMSFFRGLLTLSVLAIAISSPAAWAGVIITYKDVGPNLQFDFSGSLGYTASGSNTLDYGTVGLQNTFNPVFYSNPDTFGLASSDGLLSHTAGLWGTSLPMWTESGGYVARSGDTFLMRMNFDDSLQAADSIWFWGNWGAANNAFAGSFTVPGSIASFGMVDGYMIYTTGGVITFHADTSVPEPGTLALFALGLAGLGFKRRRKLS